MGAAVEDVHHGRGQQMRVHAANVLVQRKAGRLRSRLGNGKRGTQDGVCAKRALVLGAVSLDHGSIHHALILGLKAQQRLADLAVDVGHGVLRTLAQIAVLVTVTQLNRFESSRRGTRGDGGAAEGTVVEDNLDLNRRIAARIQDLTSVHIDDNAHTCLPVRFKLVLHEHQE